ncbi:MAG: hypothetical protein K5666_04275 [Bacilli bacterium]|nr:hypothetical protein [Bacilli bacterium]
MKDATGELSMTAVAVVAIAAIGVVFTTLVWPTIRTNILRSTYCSQAFNCTCGTSKFCTCYYNKNSDDTNASKASTASIQCPNNRQGNN